MKREGGDWTRYRALPNLVEMDFHYSEYGPREGHYSDHMWGVYSDALAAVKQAYREGRSFVFFRHGSSTSHGWKQMTARSMVRRAMRSKDATPYILRNQSIQHNTVFVAAIRPQRPGVEAISEEERWKWDR